MACSISITKMEAPKTLERLEDISMSRALERRFADDYDDDDDERIKIHTDPIKLSDFDILDSGSSVGVLDDSDIQLDIDELP